MNSAQSTQPAPARAVCHRARNDLQTAATLLHLAAARTDSSAQMAAAMEKRLGAMAVPYGLISESGQGPTLAALARSLLERVQTSRGLRARADMQVPELSLCLRLCSPLALWLHETLDNAVFYACPSDERISLRADLGHKYFVLEIRDVGPGLPAEFSLASHAGLGLSVAQAIAQGDFKGEMSLVNARPGALVRLIVPRTEFQALAGQA